MNKITIFVEGTADIKFFQDFMLEHYGLTLEKGKIGGIIDTQGKGGLEVKKNDFLRSSDLGYKNLVIFDADFPKNEGGFAKREATILAEKTKLSLQFDLFLFPNNQDDGDLEVLLENIINPLNKGIFECWEIYQNCLQNKPNLHKGAEGKYTIPARKSKIYTYLETLLEDTAKEKELAKDPKRDFRNREHWQLADINNAYIKTLKQFFDSI